MKKTVTIEVLYPEFNNLYGDRGNLLYLQRKLSASRCEIKVIETHLFDEPAFVKREDVDFLYIGPCTEAQQELELQQLIPYKEAISERIQSGKITLATGNAFELFGQYIERENGETIPALGLFEFKAKRFEKLRYNDLCLGEIVLEEEVYQITGFKNQLSHAYGLIEQPFLNMVKGCGWNPKEKQEGIRVQNFFATYLIGPILPLNPDFTEYLAKKLVGKDYAPCRVPYEQMAYACRVADITNPLNDKKKKKKH